MQKSVAFKGDIWTSLPLWKMCVISERVHSFHSSWTLIVVIRVCSHWLMCGLANISSDDALILAQPTVPFFFFSLAACTRQWIASHFTVLKKVLHAVHIFTVAHHCNANYVNWADRETWHFASSYCTGNSYPMQSYHIWCECTLRLEYMGMYL